MKRVPRSRTGSRTARGAAPPAQGSALASARIALGLALIALAMLPLYRLLDHPGTGLAGSSTVGQLDVYFDLMTTGLLLLLPIFIVGARFVPHGLEARIAAAGAWLGRIGLARYAILLALLAMALGTFFVLRVLEGLPNLIDAHAQLLHARYWAEGRLAGPLDDGGGFRAIQNALFTDHGWVSQYPPGHVLVLAAFMRLGVPWLAGPFMMAVAVFFGTLLSARLFPARPALARLAPAVLAVSPFFIAIGASYMNHVTTAAMVVVGAYALLRAWQGTMAWALLAGAAFGFSLATRPLSTVAMAAALTLLVPFTAADRRPYRFARVALLMAAGSAPFVLLLLAYNAHFFGSPFRFGYDAALGPQMSLGFHRDPWGNLYGIREAIGYTSADLLALGVNLLETPLSAVLVVGLFLVLQPRLSPAERMLTGWALAPVAANFLYWHHGPFMGPRMLHEAAPAWALLLAAATAGLVARVPPTTALKGYNLRTGLVTTALGAAVIGMVVLGPQRLTSYGGAWMPMMRTPEPDVVAPALVFVHGGWTSRITLTLAAHGYRLDQVELLMQQNSTCRMHELSEAVALRAGTGPPPEVSADPAPESLPGIVVVSPGNQYRAFRGERLTPDCERQVRSDARGILDVSPFLWRGALPDGSDDGVLYVRDLGPERNAVLIARHPGRTPYVYAMPAPDAARPLLLSYADGMAMLWGDPPSPASGAGVDDSAVSYRAPGAVPQRPSGPNR